MNPPVDLHDESTSRPARDMKPGRWQFSIRWLFGLTAAVAVVCSLVAWWGAAAMVAVLGAAAGAFLSVLLCPLIGFDEVLDDLRTDVVRCLGVGGYLVGGTWLTVAGLRWLASDAGNPSTPVLITSGMLLFFLFTVGMVVRMLWSDSDAVEAVIVTGGALIGVFIALMLLAPLLATP